jgi:hypothetical protein
MVAKDGPADLGGIPINLMSRKHRSPGLPRLIALVGIDGSGKTTQAQRLAAWLTESGTPALYALNAGGRRWLNSSSASAGCWWESRSCGGLPSAGHDCARTLVTRSR